MLIYNISNKFSHNHPQINCVPVLMHGWEPPLGCWATAPLQRHTQFYRNSPVTGDFGCVWIERKGHCTKRGPDRVLGITAYCSTGVRWTISDAEPQISEAQIQSRMLDPRAVGGKFLLCPPGSSWYREGVGAFLPPQGLASVLGKSGEEGSVQQLRASSCFCVHARPSALPLGRHQLARKRLLWWGEPWWGKYLRLGGSCRESSEAEHCKGASSPSGSNRAFGQPDQKALAHPNCKGFMDAWIVNLEKRTANALKVQSGWFLYPKLWNPYFPILWVRMHPATLMTWAATSWASIRFWEQGSGSWMPHPWKWWRPDCMELGASWSNRSCPCPWWEHWNKMIFNVPFKTNHSVILWLTLIYPCPWWVRE